MNCIQDDDPNKEQLREENKKLVEKYPFLLPRNVFSGEVLEGYNYDYLKGFSSPGWKRIFMDYCEEILPSYLKLSEENQKRFMFFELKEKYGEMRIYTSFSWEEERTANNKACARSRLTCAYCGKVPHTSNGNNLIWRSQGWITYLCKECAKKEHLKGYRKDYSEYGRYKWLKNKKNRDESFKLDYERIETKPVCRIHHWEKDKEWIEEIPLGKTW